MKDINVTEAKNRLTEIIKDVEKTTHSYAIIRNGHKAAILISSEEYESLLETLEVLSDKKAMKEIAESAKDFKAGRKIPFSKIRKDV